MKKYTFSLLILFITLNIQSQQGWFWQNPLPQGNYLSGITFTENNTSYLIGANGTLLKSTNNGSNYFLIENDITYNFTSLNFINQNTGFIGTDNGIIYKTTDGANSLSGIYLGFADKVYSIEFINNESGFLLMRSGSNKSRIFRTTNSGINWSVSFDVPDSVCIYNLSKAVGNVLYCAGERVQGQKARLYRTTDGGVTWEFVPLLLNGGLIGVYFLDQQTGFVSQFRFGRKIFKTTNSCLTWDTVGNFAPDNFQFLDNQTGFSYGNYSNGVVYITTNTGLNWDTTVNTMSGIGKIYFKSINNWEQISGSSILISINGGINWSNISSGFNDYLDDIEFVNSVTGFIASNSGKVYKTTNSGNNWQGFTVNNLINYGINCLDFVNENTGFAGTNMSRIAKTTNGGINWQVKVIDSLLGESLTGISIPSLDTGYAVGKNGSNLKTTNGGINWQVSNLPNTLYMDDICFLNNTTGYCAGREGRGVIRKTTNGGVSWITFYFDSVFYFADLYFVNTELGFAVGNKVYNEGFILRTTNGGITWDNTVLPNTYLLSSIYFVNENIGYAGANGVSYKTTSGGNNWIGIRTKSQDLHGIYFTNENTGYAVGSNGNIIKTTTGGAPIGIEPVSNNVPVEYKLFQNYPNPFNPDTKIKFSIPQNSNSLPVNIYIYDVTGREVQNLSYDNLIPGTYSIDFDGTNLATGVYFYQLIAGDFQETRKMVLMK